MSVKSSRMLVVMFVAALAGCSSMGGDKDGVAIEDKSMAADGVVTSGAAGSTGFSSYSLDDPSSPIARRVIYFEYDSAELSFADQELLAQHAGFLGAHPGHRLTLEGHTDERGSREYNIALGDRRALSVQRILELNGVAPGQLSVVSYGEEKPAALGHSDAAWRLNRRVELAYQ